jgi:hypothetical protein
MSIRNYTIFTTLFISLTCSNAFSQVNYNVSGIPENLKKNSKSVIRNYDIELEIFSDKKAVLKVNKGITILNNNGLKDAYLIESYDQFHKIKNISGIVYDESGKKVKVLKGEDIHDFSAISGYSLYEDNRYKAIDPKYLIFPFTVEYSYEIELNTLLQLPEWMVFEDYNTSVQNSKFAVITPKEYNLRYFERNYPGTVSIVSDDNTKTYRWHVENLESVEEVANSRFLENENIIVNVAPNDFVTEDYPGNAETWSNFGKWIYTLNEGRNVLMDESKSKIDLLIKNTDSDYEKVRLLYEYMQSKTRYVSIQMGIGSWQPFPAETVDRLGYGDCKALTNYMKSMLDYAGIKSYYTLVKAGENADEIISSFPSNQFNHAILCVPLQYDTLWLECTSQRIPCGYIGEFTDDRDVLLIDSSGGIMVRTKKYTAEENQMIRMSDIVLLDNGYALASIKTKYIGLAYDQIVKTLMSDQVDQKKLIFENLNLPAFELINFKYKEVKDRIPMVDEILALQINYYMTKYGNDKYIFKPALFYQNLKTPKLGKNRKSNIFIRRDFIEIDSASFTLPEGYKVETVPFQNELGSDFGLYKVSFDIKDNKLLFYRFHRINKVDIKPDRVSDYLNYLTEVYNFDNKSVIITKK